MASLRSVDACWRQAFARFGSGRLSHFPTARAPSLCAPSLHDWKPAFAVFRHDFVLAALVGERSAAAATSTEAAAINRGTLVMVVTSPFVSEGSPWEHKLCR